MGRLFCPHSVQAKQSMSMLHNRIRAAAFLRRRSSRCGFSLRGRRRHPPTRRSTRTGRERRLPESNRCKRLCRRAAGVPHRDFKRCAVTLVALSCPWFCAVCDISRDTFICGETHDRFGGVLPCRLPTNFSADNANRFGSRPCCSHEPSSLSAGWC